MIKIPSLFVRVFDGAGRRSRVTEVTRAVEPGCEWVLAGEGQASTKYDGQAHRVHAGTLWTRYDAKPGRMPPDGFEPCIAQPDPVTGHFPGWVPVQPDAPAHRWAREAFAERTTWEDGTYELCGPKVQGNPHEFTHHLLVPHGCTPVAVAPTYDAILAWLTGHPEWEGLVWAHPDGRYAKLKRRDFGLPWPPRRTA